MNKPIVGVLSTAFLLGMTASAYAVHVEAPPETTPVVAMGNVKVTLDGNVRMRGYIQQDTVKDNKNDATSLDITGYDGRVELGTKIQAGDGATGYIKLQTGTASSDVYGWGSDNGAGLMTGGSKPTNGSVSVLEGWLQYQPCNVGVRAGRMRLAEGNNLFFDHGGDSASGDDAIIVFSETNWGANVTGGMIKFAEGSTYNNHDDIDGYFGIYNHKLNDAVTLDANLTYLHRGNDSNLTTIIDGNSVPFDLQRLNLYNLGVDGSFKLGIVTLLADGEAQFGDINEDDAGNKIKAKGYAGLIKATADLTSFKVGGLVGYGSGQSADDTDWKQFVNFLTDTSYLVVIPGYRMPVPGMNGMLDTGLANLTIYQLFANVGTTCPMSGKPLALEARVSQIELNKDDATNGEKNIGTEVDAFATWQLTKNLAYKIEAAYLFAGKAWRTTFDVVDDSYSYQEDQDDAYFVRNGLELKF